MSQNTFITLVNKSVQTTVTLEEVLQQFNYYKELTTKTGEQLDWGYTEHSFPYEITKLNKQPVSLLHLQSLKDRYNEMYVGVKNAQADTELDANIIFISLPNTSTYGDKNKATEFAKFLAKKYEGELTLFNERVMYYYKR